MLLLLEAKVYWLEQIKNKPSHYRSLETTRDSKDFSLLSYVSTVASKLTYEELRSHQEQRGVLLCIRTHQHKAELVKLPIAQSYTGHTSKVCQTGVISNGPFSYRPPWAAQELRRPTGESTMCVSNENCAGGPCRWDSGRDPIKLHTCP